MIKGKTYISYFSITITAMLYLQRKINHGLFLKHFTKAVNSLLTFTNFNKFYYLLFLTLTDIYIVHKVKNQTCMLNLQRYPHNQAPDHE